LCINLSTCVLSNSYWDNDLSSLSACGTAYSPTNVQCLSSSGKTTSEMKTESTFAGWDFINIWNINEGINYPYLR